jgi:cysteine desulfurase
MSLDNTAFIYLDHAATTPVDVRVSDAMVPYLQQHYGNPSALYGAGVSARQAIMHARTQIARVLSAQPDTIVFTGSATEANNLALFGAARAHRAHGNHIITTRVEHDAVLAPCAQLEKEGFDITYIGVDATGQINLKEVIEAIRPETILISIMYANNEVGTIYPIAEIGKYLLQYRKKHKVAYPLLHTDACQAVNYLDISVERLHVDLMSMSASKIYGPKGVGALYVRRAIVLEPIIFGGGQEKGVRSGTEHVAGIVGLSAAIEIAQTMKEHEGERLYTLQAYFWRQLKDAFGDGVVLNGPTISSPPMRGSQRGLKTLYKNNTQPLPASPHRGGDDDKLTRLPNNLNVSFLGYEGEQIVLYLDAKGIAAATGSACTASSDDSSHVLSAMGLPVEYIQSAVRFSMGRSTTKKEIDTTIVALQHICRLLGA